MGVVRWCMVERGQSKRAREGKGGCVVGELGTMPSSFGREPQTVREMASSGGPQKGNRKCSLWKLNPALALASGKKNMLIHHMGYN